MCLGRTYLTLLCWKREFVHRNLSLQDLHMYLDLKTSQYQLCLLRRYRWPTRQWLTWRKRPHLLEVKLLFLTCSLSECSIRIANHNHRRYSSRNHNPWTLWKSFSGLPDPQAIRGLASPRCVWVRPLPTRTKCGSLRSFRRVVWAQAWNHTRNSYVGSLPSQVWLRMKPKMLLLQSQNH